MPNMRILMPMGFFGPDIIFGFFSKSSDFSEIIPGDRYLMLDESDCFDL